MPSDTNAPGAAPPAAAAAVDEAVRRVLRAVAPAAAPWRRAVVAAVEELRALLGTAAAPDAAAHALGAFAAGRIDVDRFAGIVTRARPVEGATLLRLRVAFDTLRTLADRSDDDVLVVDVPPGSSLRDAVSAACAELGRSFGAAHEAALARQGTFRESEHGNLHTHYPFARWNRRERGLAPPLVVRVDGSDLDAAGLASFLDGAAKFALVVRGPCPPAALVRLVTPGTFVMQTADPDAFARLAAAAGPGVAALVPDGAAHFVHDPAAGHAIWDRVRVTSVPAAAPRRTVAGWSPDQQADELAQLVALALRPSSIAVAAAARIRAPGESDAAAADPAGRLAAWLLEASGPRAAPPSGAPVSHG